MENSLPTCFNNQSGSAAEIKLVVSSLIHTEMQSVTKTAELLDWQLGAVKLHFTARLLSHQQKSSAQKLLLK